jgi:SAM-dependent methyltransferase
MSSLIEVSRKIHDKDVAWTERNLSYTIFHSAYWAQTRVRGAIAAHASVANGTLLDVGCGLKPYKDLFLPFIASYIGLEYSPASGYRGNSADICGDAAELPIADASIDTILCTETLSNLPSPETTIREFARVLKPGGLVITTAAFVYPLYDKIDYFRFSRYGIAELIKRSGLEVEKVVPLSGTAVTLSLIFNLYWYDVGFIWTRWLYPIGLILRPLLWLGCLVVNLLGGLFEIALPDYRLSFGHLTIARKSRRNGPKIINPYVF